MLIGSRVGDPREMQVNIRVMVGWTDRQGRLLRESSAVPLPSELIDVQGTGNVVPEPASPSTPPSKRPSSEWPRRSFP